MVTVDLPATSKNIDRLMRSVGATPKSVADMCGFSTPQAVYKWLRGQNLPSIDNLVVLAFMCGVTIDDIIIRRKI